MFTLRYGSAFDGVTDGRRATEDPMLVAQSTLELFEDAREFFRVCAENNITLNLRKVQWNKPEVLFGGFLVNSEGYQIDPSVSKALHEFPRPKCQTDVCSFFGLANQTCNFSTEIADLLVFQRDRIYR